MARETREMAVLFADLTNSTGLYQKLGDVAARAQGEEARQVALTP